MRNLFSLLLTEPTQKIDLARRKTLMWSLCPLLCCPQFGRAAGTGWTGYLYSPTKLASSPTLELNSKHEAHLEAKKFLLRFGYAKTLPNDTVLDGTTVEALKRFQAVSGLEVTGRLDLLTRNTMVQPRCAMPDWNDPLGALSVGGWKKKKLIYCFGNKSQAADASVFRQKVESAFSTWAAVPGAGLEFTETQDIVKCDILVKWVAANDADRTMVGPLVAHADFPPGYSLISKSVPLPLHFDDEETKWSFVGQGIDMESVALHEIGHCLGLVHSNDPSSVMYATVSEGQPKVLLHGVDIEAINALYA
jgi:hypothetical protein